MIAVTKYVAYHLIFQIRLNIQLIQSSETTKFIYGNELMRFFIQMLFNPFQELPAISFTLACDSLNIFWIYANSGCFHVKKRVSKIQYIPDNFQK